MGAQGHTTVDFGASPGIAGTTVVKTITGQAGILAASSEAEAWLRCMSSADHSGDEHFIENIRVRAGNIVDATGFDIFVECTLGKTYGVFNVSWVWN